MSLGWGDIDGSVSPMLWRDDRPASGQLPARSAGNPVHRAAGQPVRRPELLGYGRIRARQGAAAALVVELGAWHSEPRYVLAGLPPARPPSLRGSVPQLHGGLCAGGEDRPAERCRRDRWQGVARGLRAGPEPYATRHGERLGCADPHDAGQHDRAGRQRSRSGAATGRTAAAQGVCRDRRRLALPSGNGPGDPRPRRRLRPGAEGQPAGAAARCRGALAAEPSAQLACTAERGHDRDEIRTARVVPAGFMAVQHDFAGLAAIARVKSRRGAEPPVVRNFLLSRRWPAGRVLQIVRAHWGIENTLHWSLDVTLDEDLARNRKDNGPANLAVLRRLALNIAAAHPDTKTSLRRKFLRAGWDDRFLFDLIRHMR